MAATPVIGDEALGSVEAAVDEVLAAYLRQCATDLGRIDAAAAMLVDEIARLVLAGGKRLRPAFCVWGYRAAPGARGKLPLPGGRRRMSRRPGNRSCARRRRWSCSTRWR